ncbi:hypothetical protein [Streptomyces sp. NRRL S-481]|nr:hypothetical protein [Streptomyces sp. NRRL S-481]
MAGDEGAAVVGQEAGAAGAAGEVVDADEHLAGDPVAGTRCHR